MSSVTTGSASKIDRWYTPGRMAAATAPVWVPVVTGLGTPIGVIVGYGVKSLDDFLKEERTTQRKAARRLAERDDAARDRRDAFQRERLLSLQHAMHDLSIAGLAYDFEVQQGIANDATFNQITDAQVRVSMFVVRILDDDARRRVSDFNTVLKRMSAPTNRATADDLTQANQNANQRIGELFVPCTKGSL